MKREIPIEACRYQSGLSIGDNGADAKTAPFGMVARTGDPIDHWYWGKVTHDLNGFSIPGGRSRVAIDYEHDSKEVIGFANRFDTESGDLVASGTLVPYKESDRATEVIFKSRAGVPYEASINFAGDGIEIEEVPEGASAQVNNREFTGPGVIVRKWQLRSIAVTPSGADSNTSTTVFSNDSATINVDVIEKEDEMENQVTPEAEVLEETQAVESATVEDSSEAVETEDNVSEVETAVEEQEPVAALSASEPVANTYTGLDYLEQFGEHRGGVYFAKGIPFEEALSQDHKELRSKLSEANDRIAELEALVKVAQGSDADSDAVSFTQRVEDKDKVDGNGFPISIGK